MNKQDKDRHDQILENQRRNATRWKGTPEQKQEAQRLRDASREQYGNSNTRKPPGKE